ncbi:MAG: MopE-related protein [Myxococcota bacterium]
MLLLLLVGCLIDRAGYEERRAALTDDDGDGASEVDGDCDDADAAVGPGATERCNGADEDCDGQIDEDVADADWYADADGDGFGGGSALLTCDPPEGFVDLGGDCDDTDAARFPGAAERCNTLDDDCDGEVDDPAEVEPLEWFTDADADGYGTGTPVVGCTDPGGAAREDGDCDDADASANPGATEACNGYDDDCNGTVDDAPAVTWYLDRDEDGYGDDDSTYLVCSPPPGYAALGGDCDDVDDARHPDATDVCEDGVDGNCDGVEAPCGLTPGESTAADMSARFVVSGSETYVARTVASAGDLDGDGDDELVVARPGKDDLTGAVALIPGRPGLYLGEYDLDADAALLSGVVAEGAFGYAVSGGQDTNGDGTCDLLVSAINEDRAYLFTDGAAALAGGLDSRDAALVLVGPGTAGSFGVAVTLLGDLDSDGVGDWLVGDYLYDGTGAAFLYYGSDAGGGREIGVEEEGVVRLQATTLTEDAGHETSRLGDLDGDGLTEFAIWDALVDSSESAHRAYLVVSSGDRLAPGDPGPQAEVFTGPVEGDTFETMVGLGDMDGDGHEDAAFGASGLDGGTGGVYLLRGAPVITGGRPIAGAASARFLGMEPGQGLGRSIAGVGDLDGDGYPELAAGNARGDDIASGNVWLFGGRASIAGEWTIADAWASIEGASTEEEGEGIAGALDVNGDGAADLLVTAWDPGSLQGQAWLAYGKK